MTGKERAAFRSAANQLQAIQQIGHAGISEETVKNIDAALTARELIKLRVLETCPLSAKEAAEQLASTLSADVIQVIGHRFVLYRKRPEEE